MEGGGNRQPAFAPPKEHPFKLKDSTNKLDVRRALSRDALRDSSFFKIFLYFSKNSTAFSVKKNPSAPPLARWNTFVFQHGIFSFLFPPFLFFVFLLYYV